MKREEVKRIICESKHSLSDADISIIALAKQMKDKGKKVYVVSDDYSIQDICKRMNIFVISLIRGETNERYEWKKICSGCGKEIEGEFCDVCGHKGKYVKKREK